ncbi:MAG TPA: hypothetical protein VE079_04445 [Ensifer sp.]|nr:hypothetical protein [Ensifer sp.]
MSDTVTNELIYETLKRMQETLALHNQFHLETKERLGFIEQHYASVPSRVDRIDQRLDRIERRLDLVEV